MSFTYDPTTPLGQTRMFCGDTNSAQQKFSDAELYALLAIYTDPLLTASYAIEGLATNAAYIARMLEAEEYRRDDKAIAQEIRNQAKELRARVVMTPIVNPPTQVFVPAENGCPGMNSLW